MSDDEGDDNIHLQPLNHNASRDELLEALTASQLSVVKLLAENRELRKSNNDLLATSSKKRRKGGEEDLLGYKGQVVGLAKSFLFTRALCIHATAFQKNPPPPTAIGDRFGDNKRYNDGVTADLYRHIPEKFHPLLNLKEYGNFAKDFIREHGDGRSVLISAVRKALPVILQQYNVGSEVLPLLASANADRKNNKTLEGLLRFPNERRATLYAPILFPGPTQNMSEVFTAPAVMQVHRMMLFGPGSLTVGSKPAPNSNGVKLGCMEITESSVSTAATITRFVLSPDKEWAVKGAISGVEWEEDYRAYHQMLACNRHLPHVKKIFRTIHNFVFAGLTASSTTIGAESGSDTEADDGISDALRRFQLGSDETGIDDGDNGDNIGAGNGGEAPRVEQDDEPAPPIEEEVVVPVAPVIRRAPRRAGSRK
ncbi:hypothetical protein C8R46DRAFT_1208635 [Mycena filopes]|nr:hypothetical protein C8R46DRAFT_1208635 [Mycena filopes]